MHWEFWSENPGSISDCYKEVFDWNVRHIPEMNYRLVETGGEGGINGGIMTPQKGSWPSNLALYIDVDDLDVYNDRIRKAVPKDSFGGPLWGRENRGGKDGCSRGWTALLVPGS